MKSGTYFEGGAAESSAIIEADQGLAGKCGEIGPVEAKREFSTAPAPSLREKLRLIRASDHPARHWARNVIQIMDELKGSPDDPDMLRALARAVAMFERKMGIAVTPGAPAVLTNHEISEIFGLAGSLDRHQ